MSIVKSKQMNWQLYAKLLAESFYKPSDIEKLELAGYLLRADCEGREGEEHLKALFSQNNHEIADVIATFLVAESPDAIFDLLVAIKKLVMDYYSDSITTVIKEAVEDYKFERSLQDPRDEHNSDEEVA